MSRREYRVTDVRVGNISMQIKGSFDEMISKWLFERVKTEKDFHLTSTLSTLKKLKIEEEKNLPHFRERLMFCKVARKDRERERNGSKENK